MTCATSRCFKIEVVGICSGDVPIGRTMASPHSPSQAQTTLRSSPQEAAQYIADMVMELRNLAKAEKLHALREYLEVAYYEAFMQAHKTEVPPGEQEYLEQLAEDVRRSEAP